MGARRPGITGLSAGLGAGLAAPQIGVGLRVFAYDRGDPVQIVGSATLARCMQHETDHLDGIVFIDRMDPATRKLAMRAIREAPWSGLGPAASPPVRVSPHPLGGHAR